MTRTDKKVLCAMFLFIVRGVFALIAALIPHENEYAKSYFDDYREFVKEVKGWAGLPIDEAVE